MGDNATEIDLDSVIDRLLEGTYSLFTRQIRTLLVSYDTSIDPFLRIGGGILSVRALVHHKVPWLCCVMWILVTDFKERRKGRVPRLSREVVYYSHLLIAAIKQPVILSLPGSLPLILTTSFPSTRK